MSTQEHTSERIVEQIVMFGTRCRGREDHSIGAGSAVHRKADCRCSRAANCGVHCRSPGVCTGAGCRTDRRCCSAPHRLTRRIHVARRVRQFLSLRSGLLCGAACISLSSGLRFAWPQELKSATIDLASSEGLDGMEVDTSSLKWIASSCPVFNAQLYWLQADC